MSDRESPSPRPALEDFLEQPTRDLDAWRWLWDGDHPFPITTHRGPLGRLVVAFKRLLRPLVKVPQNDLWERQRVFNLIVLEQLERSREVEEALAEIDRLRWNAQEFKDLSVFLTRFVRSGVEDIVGHNDALFSRVDQKLDRYRRESQRLWSVLGSSLEAARASGDAADELRRARDEVAYLELEERHRGDEADISERFRRYFDLLPVGGAVLDVGCGRGEALSLLKERGLEARGVDLSSSMVALCKEKGLDVRQGNLIEALAEEAEGSLAAVVSLHVIEHLAWRDVAALIRLSWRALQPGGVLLLETPNPLSVVVAARNFWLDPTHLRPVHPEGLAAVMRSAGFDQVRRLEQRPFAEEDRLPEISLQGLEGENRELADRINRLRDRLDELLFGYQDYALAGFKPAT